jgi:hypothetical protein
MANLFQVVFIAYRAKRVFLRKLSEHPEAESSIMHCGNEKHSLKAAGSVLIRFPEVHGLPDFFTSVGRYLEWAKFDRTGSALPILRGRRICIEQ